MRKGISIFLTVLMLCGNGIPLQAEEAQQTIHVYVHAAQVDTIPCPQTEYDVYQDAQGTVPLNDADGQPYVCITDENGRSELTLPEEPFYLKCRTPAKGYYAGSEVLPGTKDMTVGLYPIRFAFSCGDRIPEMKLRQEDGTVLSLEEAQAGKTYTAWEETGSNYHAAKPVSVSIPFQRDEKNDPIYVSTEDQVFGTADLHFTEGTKETAGVKYEIDQDEICTHIGTDVYGKELSGISTEEMQSLSLLPGRWYVKILDLPLTDACINEAVPFDVQAETNTDVKVPLVPMKLQVHVNDVKTGKPVKADITCMQKDAVLEGTGEYDAKRAETYQIHAAVQEPGYFNIESTSVTVPADAEETMQVTLPAVPFVIQVNGVDGENGDAVGIKYELHDLQGNPVDTVHAGDTVVYHETECESGYSSASDQQLSVPLTSGEPMTYTVTFSHEPFVVTAVNAPAGTQIGLYTDPACTELAEDRTGAKAMGQCDASGVYSAAMVNGTYFVKENSIPEGYRFNDGIHKIVCDRRNGPFLQTAFHNERIALQIQSMKLDEELAGVTYDILEDGQVLQSVNSTGNDCINHDIYAGHTYEIAVSHLDGQFLYEEKQSVTISEDGQDASVCFTYVPYVNLVLSTEAKTEVKGALYKDQECTKKAADVYGSSCDLFLSSFGTTFKMAPGTYWFRSEAASHYYITVSEVHVSAGEETVQQKIALQGAEVTISFLNQDTAGHTMELRDELGNLIKTWKADGEEEVDAQRLEPGKEYVLEDKDSGEKTEFTLPQQAPEEKPVVKVEQKKDETARPTEKTVPQVVWMAGGAAVLLVITAGGILHHHKQM